MKKIISFLTCMTCTATIMFSQSAGQLSSNNGTITAYSGSSISISWSVAPSPAPDYGAGNIFWYMNPHTGAASYIVGGGGYYSNPSSLSLSTSGYIFCQLKWAGGVTANTNEIYINIFPAFNPGTISPAGTAICYNTSPGKLVFSSSPTGGDPVFTKTYQWQSKNTSILAWIPASGTGANTNEFTPNALTSDTKFRCLVDAGAGSLPTNELSFTVNPEFKPGAINGAKEICYNTDAGILGFSTEPSGGVGGYTRLWQKNTGNGWEDTGETLTSYSPGALTATTPYRCKVTNSCGILYTEPLTIIVGNDLNPGTITTNALTTFDICPNGEASAIIFNTEPSGQTGTFSYQWQSSFNNSSWSNISGKTSATLNPGIITATSYFRCMVAVTGTCNITKYTEPVKFNMIDGYVVATPQINSINAKYCKNDTIVLSVANPNTKNNWYLENSVTPKDSVSFSVTNFTKTTKVYAEAIDIYGCKSAKAEVTINMDPIKADFYASPIEIKINDSTRFRSTSIAASTLNWYFGGGLPNATGLDPYAYYYHAGVFSATLTVTSDIGCTDTKTIEKAVYVGVSGLQKVTNESLFVYPIPVSETLTIEYSGNSDANAFIYSLNGQLEKEIKLHSEKNSLDVSNLEKGTYILKVVTNAGGNYSKTLIVE